MKRFTACIPLRAEPDDVLLLSQVAANRGITRSKVLRELIRSLAMAQESENPPAATTIPQ